MGETEYTQGHQYPLGSHHSYSVFFQIWPTGRHVLYICSVRILFSTELDEMVGQSPLKCCSHLKYSNLIGGKISVLFHQHYSRPSLSSLRCYMNANRSQWWSTVIDVSGDPRSPFRVLDILKSLSALVSQGFSSNKVLEVIKASIGVLNIITWFSAKLVIFLSELVSGDKTTL